MSNAGRYVVVIHFDLAEEFRTALGNIEGIELVEAKEVNLCRSEIGRLDCGFRFIETDPVLVPSLKPVRREKPWYAKFDKRPRK